MKFNRFIYRAGGILLLLSLLIFAFLLPCAAYTENGKITVVLDPGHYDGDLTGGTWAASKHEAYYNMKVALACKAVLDADGRFQTYLSHPDNENPATIYERAAKADSVNADLLFSIHFDGVDGIPNMNGAEVYVSVLPEYDMTQFAGLVLNELTAATDLSARGIFQREDTGDGEHLYYWDRERAWDIPDDRSAGPLSDYYGILTWGAKFNIPSVIVEHGFMTNAHDRAIAEDDNNLRAMGEADARAIIAYFTGHTHKWSSSPQCDYASNCCMTGKSSYRCSVCGCRKGTVSLAPAPDNHYYYISEHTEPTCTARGRTVYTCRYLQNLIDKECPGIDSDTSHSYVVYTPPTGHHYVVTEDTPLTHVHDGVHTEVCTNCGDTFTVKQPAEGHNFILYSHTDPTCETPGEDVMRCSGCGETVTKVLPALGHVNEVTENRVPTCTEAGIHTEVCSVCGKTVSLTIPSSGHRLSVTEDTPATCTGAGVYVEICSVCGEEVREVRPALGHVFCDTEIIAAACTEDGRHVVRCSVCGTEECTVLPKTGHDWDDGTVERKPSLLRDGKLLYVCKNDSAHTRIEAIPKRITEPEVQRTAAGIAAAAGVCAAGFAAVLIFLHRRKKVRAAGETDAPTDDLTDDPADVSADDPVNDSADDPTDVSESDPPENP